MTAPRGPRVQALFSRITPRYDLINEILSLGLVGYWRHRALQQTGLRSGNQALDLCTGTGTLSVLLARQVGSSGQVIGLDFCGPMLADACRRFPAGTWPQLRFVQGDAHALPFPANAWNAATMAFGLRNLDDPETALREIHRMLVPGGRVVILELTRPSWPWLAWLHGLFLRWVVPMVGGLVSGQFGAYRYLSTSVAGFMEATAVSDMLVRCGFRDVRVTPLNGGICSLMVGVR